jgi:APA family basic amino acid/polyamine antiporter
VGGGDAERAPIESRVTGLARRLGVFDATMIVMGGIIGAGIFINPYVVARHVHTPAVIIGVWAAGGVIALAGAFVYAELAAIRPGVGGVYAYLRDAFHPVVAFLYGWTLLLVVQTGGMAAVAVTFGNYVRELSGTALSATAIAVGALAILTIVNCFGVRAGANVQSALMVLKILAITALVTVGWLAVDTRPPAADLTAQPRDSLTAIGAAMVPVLFAYGGWQTASFVSGEMKEPQRDLPRALLWGVASVVALYLAVNVVCVLALGPAGLAATTTPASEVMRRALGDTGAHFIAAGIAVSTIGFLSQGMLTAPRVYFAMARDGVFFSRVGWLDPRSRAPVFAILLQGVWAAVIALSGRYEQILNYVVAIDALFFGLTGAALLIFRRREARGLDMERARFRTPGHPWTTTMFVGAFWLLALNTVIQFPTSAGIGVLVLLAGLPMYLWWSRRALSDARRSQ